MTTIPNLPPSLSPALTGREAISDAVFRFVQALDTSDLALFDSVFMPESTFEINGRLIEGLPALHTDCFEAISKLDTTHFVTNIRINIADSATEASLTASALSQHYGGGKGMQPDQKRLLVGSLYYVDLVKDSGDENGLWKIKAFNMNSTWAEGDWGVLRGE
ncbi:hypothetical protein P170DRAFT_504876 [Aspergillus steynii IBT 23096]|uniref:SnoaL-like domain-containing protein n=1 Tax=Aspergillus steynii IBT 23096 TaxID=1392250 RepID=A0A2I2GME0_9EURO|nr:uncharacterized protein P170DRAFT_504876 [Aspergillus steynii IBT 23096]PLB54052.1 hypothetical protein P170DRAFT_504876 [Aspergillus steynii IBT 23096]